MRRTIINEYIILLNDGNRITITASNIRGAKRQAFHIKGVVSVTRVYKSGKGAVCPW